MLPLSTAVMRLFDGFDGGFMNAPPTGAVAYPIRKMYYNFTITGLSVVVALSIGTIELVGVLDLAAQDQLGRFRLPV